MSNSGDTDDLVNSFSYQYILQKFTRLNDSSKNEKVTTNVAVLHCIHYSLCQVAPQRCSFLAVMNLYC